MLHKCHHCCCIKSEVPSCPGEETKIIPLALDAAFIDKEFPLSKLKRALSSQCAPMKHKLTPSSQRLGQSCRIPLAFCKTETHFPILHFIVTLSSHLLQTQQKISPNKTNIHRSGIVPQEARLEGPGSQAFPDCRCSQ